LNREYVAQPWQLTAKRAKTYALFFFPYEGKVPETRSVEGGKGTKKEKGNVDLPIPKSLP